MQKQNISYLFVFSIFISHALAAPPPCEAPKSSLIEKLSTLSNSPHELKGAMTPEIEMDLNKVVKFLKNKVSSDHEQKTLETAKKELPCVPYTMTEVKVGGIKLANGNEAPSEFQQQVNKIKNIAEVCVAHQQVKGAFWIELENRSQQWYANTVVNATAKKMLQKCLEDSIHEALSDFNYKEINKVYLPIYFNQIKQ